MRRDRMSAWTCRQLTARPTKDCSASSSNPMMEGPWCRFRREARARERHRHRMLDSLKVLDPEVPIREADTGRTFPEVCFGQPLADEVDGSRSRHLGAKV